MKITPAVLSIPPYLSTPWTQILSMQSRPLAGAYTLMVTLKTGALIEVPGLDQAALNEIFEAHAQYSHQIEPISFNLPLRSDGPIQSLGPTMEHDPSQANHPDLPPEVLDRMATIAKAFGLDDTSALPAPEPDCNCVYCQILRSFGASPSPEEEVLITEADLHFRDWEITQQADKLYTVTNPLDKNEHYSVFLGTPIGCTCGQKNCEHIKAVLNS